MAKLTPIDRLTGDLIFVAFKAALAAYGAVVRTGVVSPADVEAFIDGLTDHIGTPAREDAEQQEQLDQLRAAIESQMLPHCAALRQEAAQFYRG